MNILTIDDEWMVRDIMAAVCVDWGHTGYVASDIGEALAVLRRTRIDLVLLDYMLGGAPATVDGETVVDEFELAAAIHRIQPGARVIVVTGMGVEGIRERFSEAGVMQIETKPLDIAKLKEEVDALASELGTLPSAEQKHTSIAVYNSLRWFIEAPRKQPGVFIGCRDCRSIREVNRGLSVCIFCGGLKLGALVPCIFCGQAPRIPEDVARSMLLMDHYVPELTSLARSVTRAIEAGEAWDDFPEAVEFKRHWIAKMTGEDGSVDIGNLLHLAEHEVGLATRMLKRNRATAQSVMCPHCDCIMRLRPPYAFVPGHRIPPMYVRRSDGLAYDVCAPHMERVVSCPYCKEPFWRHNADPVELFETGCVSPPPNEDDGSEDQVLCMEVPAIEEVEMAIDPMPDDWLWALELGLAKTATVTLLFRLKAWWRFNDALWCLDDEARIKPPCYPDLMLFNLRALLAQLDPGEWLLRAEILRSLRRFDEALAELDKGGGASQFSGLVAADEPALRERAQRRDTRLFRLDLHAASSDCPDTRLGEALAARLKDI